MLPRFAVIDDPPRLQARENLRNLLLIERMDLFDCGSIFPQPSAHIRTEGRLRRHGPKAIEYVPKHQLVGIVKLAIRLKVTEKRICEWRRLMI